MLRTLGRYAGQLKRTAGEFRSQFDDAIRESELDELRSSLSEAADLNPVNQIRDSVTESLKPLEDAARDIKGGIEKPASTEEPSDTKPADDKASKSESKAKAKPTSKAKSKAAETGEQAS